MRETLKKPRGLCSRSSSGSAGSSGGGGGGSSGQARERGERGDGQNLFFYVAAGVAAAAALRRLFCGAASDAAAALPSQAFRDTQKFSVRLKKARERVCVCVYMGVHASCYRVRVIGG